MDVRDLQRQRLRSTIDWARKLRTALEPLLVAQGERVHFRPSSKGVAMVGLLPDRPQRGKSGIRNLARVIAEFDALFAAYCRDVPQGRATGEKALQSYLISESYKNGRRMVSINAASRSTDDPVDLLFIADEIALPVPGGKLVCDILALRSDAGRSTPVLLELKDSRMLTRLVEQVDDYAKLMDEHADLFAELFGALLGETVTFDGNVEKWIVWPASRRERDTREEELQRRGIRAVGYTRHGSAYSFAVSSGAARVEPEILARELRIGSLGDSRLTNLVPLGWHRSPTTSP